MLDRLFREFVLCGEKAVGSVGNFVGLGGFGYVCLEGRGGGYRVVISDFFGIGGF